MELSGGSDGARNFVYDMLTNPTSSRRSTSRCSFVYYFWIYSVPRVGAATAEASCRATLFRASVASGSDISMRSAVREESCRKSLALPLVMCTTRPLHIGSVCLLFDCQSRTRNRHELADCSCLFMYAPSYDGAHVHCGPLPGRRRSGSPACECKPMYCEILGQVVAHYIAARVDAERTCVGGGWELDRRETAQIKEKSLAVTVCVLI